MSYDKHWRVLDAALPRLKANRDGMTNRDIAEVVPYRYVTVKNAMSAAERAGIVERCGTRRVSRSGHPFILWRAVLGGGVECT